MSQCDEYSLMTYYTLQQTRRCLIATVIHFSHLSLFSVTLMHGVPREVISRVQQQ